LEQTIFQILLYLPLKTMTTIQTADPNIAVLSVSLDPTNVQAMLPCQNYVVFTLCDRAHGRQWRKVTLKKNRLL
jgi:hypothetical protein